LVSSSGRLAAVLSPHATERGGCRKFAAQELPNEHTVAAPAVEEKPEQREKRLKKEGRKIGAKERNRIVHVLMTCCGY
jgi:hypothetical protein